METSGDVPVCFLETGIARIKDERSVEVLCRTLVLAFTTIHNAAIVVPDRSRRSG